MPHRQEALGVATGHPRDARHHAEQESCSSTNTARMGPARVSTRAQYFGVARELYERVSVPERFRARRGGSRALARGDRERVPRRQSMAQARDDRGELPAAKPARHQGLLRPRSVAAHLRRQRGPKAALPGEHDRRAAGQAA